MVHLERPFSSTINDFNTLEEMIQKYGSQEFIDMFKEKIRHYFKLELLFPSESTDFQMANEFYAHYYGFLTNGLLDQPYDYVLNPSNLSSQYGLKILPLLYEFRIKMNLENPEIRKFFYNQFHQLNAPTNIRIIKTDGETEGKEQNMEGSPLKKLPENQLKEDNKASEENSINESTSSSPLEKQNPGGIDLNPQTIEMDKRGVGVNFQLPAFDQEQFQNMNIEGFLPIIINISPITNIPLLLGLTDTEEIPTDLGFESLDPLEKRDRFKFDKPKQLSFLN